jgi:hypothetical protein
MSMKSPRAATPKPTPMIKAKTPTAMSPEMQKIGHHFTLISLLANFLNPPAPFADMALNDTMKPLWIVKDISQSVS